MERPLTARIELGGPPPDLAAYQASGGYEAARTAVRELEPSALIEEVKRSRLRGRGGAGFPTGVKWSLLDPNAPRPRYLVANADEMEPGTFKDRYLLEGDPHGLIEGMILAGWAIGAEIGYIFLRQAYVKARHRLEQALSEARAAGLLGEDVLGTGWRYDIHVHVGVGRYICGEETALLNALEGKRAVPRAKPPYPQASGLFGQPTIVQNVETLYCVPHIVKHGADWFLGLSRSEDGGTKLYGASGRVARPGLWELPLGATLGEVLNQAGGMRDGLRFRGCLPGGASTDFLTADHLDVPLDFTQVQKAGSRLGTGTLVVLDDQTCPVGMVLNLERFFARESCGWCTPCREGLPWTARLLEAIERGQGRPRDLELLERHTHQLGMGFTFCALAPGAMEPLQSALRHFRDDFQRHIELHRCPYR